MKLRISTNQPPRKIAQALRDNVPPLTGIMRVIAIGAMNIANRYKRAVQKGPATGKVYKRGGVEHQASAKGEAPMTDQGTLVSSILHRAQQLRAEAGSMALYSPFLEPDRPALGPAVDEETPRIWNALDNLFRRATR